MNVLFLDVDGVLNDYDTKDISPDGYRGIDDKYVKVLSDVVNKFNFTIVLSSDWKLYASKKDYEYLETKLSKFGLKIHEKTPNARRADLRGQEINEWLQEHIADVENFIVLDDNSFEFVKYPNIYHNYIQTYGLRDSVCCGNVNDDDFVYIVQRYIEGCFND